MHRPAGPECQGALVALRSALGVLSGKWKLQIILALRLGARHFRGLERSIPGLSTKVLAKELRDLEANQLIRRTVHAGPPVVVEYEVLPYALTLDPVIAILREWGQQHQQRVAASAPPAADPAPAPH